MLVRLRSDPISEPRRNLRSWGLLALFLSGIITAILISPGAQSAQLFGFSLLPCLLKSTTGIPCPFCGLTRGAAWMARGELVNAWSNNILSPLVAVGVSAAAVYVVLGRMAAGKRLTFELSAKARRCAYWTAALLIIASWIVNLLKLGSSPF